MAWGPIVEPLYKDTPWNEDIFFNQDTTHSPSYIEQCTKLPLKWGHLLNQDTLSCPKGIRNRGVSLYNTDFPRACTVHTAWLKGVANRNTIIIFSTHSSWHQGGKTMASNWWDSPDSIPLPVRLLPRLMREPHSWSFNHRYSNLLLHTVPNIWTNSYILHFMIGMKINKQWKFVVGSVHLLYANTAHFCYREMHSKSTTHTANHQQQKLTFVDKSYL